MHADRTKQIETPYSKQRTGRAADYCQQHALAKNLTQDLRPRRTECDTDSKLALTRTGTREKHGREICARDQKHDADSSKQDEQRRLHSTDDLFVQRIKCAAEAYIGIVVIGKLFEPVRVDGVDLHLRLSGRDPLLQPADDAVAA